MTKVERIQAEIAKLKPSEARKVSQWLDEYLADKWDRQIAEDAKAGRLDFLFDEAEKERKDGRLREWPSPRK